MDLYGEESEIKTQFGNLTEFVTTMTTVNCVSMQTVFFNDTTLTLFNQEMQKLSEMNGTVEDESGKKIGEPESNPLEGYKIKEFSLYLKDKQTKNELSYCKITGPSEEDRLIKID